MQMMNRAIEDAADFRDFMKRVAHAKKINDAEVAAQLQAQAAAHGPSPTSSSPPASRFDGESRTQRRARERAEKKAAVRAAKAPA